MAINVNPERCDRCGACIGVCPTNALMLLADNLVIDHAACTGCKTCVNICPVGALHSSPSMEKSGATP
ncbi:MAG: 4Fe-4S binding protein [Chitinispirillaceae bacterium]|nr:4Fe-4S binding protein [Chitinispirillaceae bacterium]